MAAPLVPSGIEGPHMVPFAEVEIGQIRNWPKSKLIGRNRTDGVRSVSFSLSFFLFC